jgi:hypothetical protein
VLATRTSTSSPKSSHSRTSSFQGPDWFYTARAKSAYILAGMPNSEIVVMKFGGTSVADAERIQRAAAPRPMS